MAVGASKVATTVAKMDIEKVRSSFKQLIILYSIGPATPIGEQISVQVLLVKFNTAEIFRHANLNQSSRE